MKYLQIAALVVAGAVGGVLFMQWKGEPTPAGQTPPAAEQPSQAENAAPPKAAPAAVPETQHAPQVPAPVGTPAAKSQARKPSAIASRKTEPAGSETAEQASSSQPPPAAAPSPAPQQQAQPALPESAPARAVTTPPTPPPPRRVTLAAGTLIPVRTVEALSSDRNQPGDTFTATLDEPLVADGFVIAERGAKLEGRVVQSQRAGRVKGVSDIAIELTRLSTSDGQKVAIQTDPFEKQGATSKGSDVAKVGAAAGIGAAIGAIAGGGKGAGIGAAIGGAAGTGGVLATRGKPAVVNSETKISFRLSQPVTITEKRR